MTRLPYGRFCDEVVVQTDLLRAWWPAPTCR
jgi:hypothetical protein